MAGDWTPAERALFRRLDTPFKIQLYLNRLGYDAAPGTRSPRWVIREKKANCFEGALLAAAVLGFHGRPRLVLDLRAVNDDDHVLAVFRRGGRFGAIAKSNYTMIRFREPVYRTPRELVLSYFDLYFNPLGEKTLREYSRPMSLARFDRRGWMTTERDISDIGDALDAAKHYPIVSPREARRLEPVDRDVLRAGLLVADKAGLYKAGKG
jgi:hypothetical protein